VRVFVPELVDDCVELRCFSGSVRVAENRDGRIVCIELIEVPSDVGVAEVVVEDDGRQLDVRILLGTVVVVLATTDRVPEFVGVGRERMAVKESDVVRLFRVSMIDPASPSNVMSLALLPSRRGLGSVDSSSLSR
jgi:hypothetical protein